MPISDEGSLQRRAFSAPRGKIISGGDVTLAKVLAQALRERGDVQPYTHGLHVYPARFPPLLCRRLITAAQPRTLLDPFCGSGTSLVEGRVFGARVFGSDINPLGARLSRLKATSFSNERLENLLTLAQQISEASLDRVEKRARTKTSGDEIDDPKWFAPHTFRELIGLREEIFNVDEADRDVLLLALTSIVQKVSQQKALTSQKTVTRNIAKGGPSRLYLRRVEEWTRRMAEFTAAVPKGTPPAAVYEQDARTFAAIAEGSVDAIVTSPPYLGTYDYAGIEERFLSWLGVKGKTFRKKEIGRRASDPAAAVTAWRKDLLAFFKTFARALNKKGIAFVVMGDSVVGNRTLPANEFLRGAATENGFEEIAWAHEARPAYYGKGETRLEHIMAFRKK